MNGLLQMLVPVGIAVLLVLRMYRSRPPSSPSARELLAAVPRGRAAIAAVLIVGYIVVGNTSFGTEDSGPAHAYDIAGPLSVYVALWFTWRGYRADRPPRSAGRTRDESARPPPPDEPARPGRRAGLKSFLTAVAVGLIGILIGVLVQHFWPVPCGRGDDTCWADYRATHHP